MIKVILNDGKTVVEINGEKKSGAVIKSIK